MATTTEIFESVDSLDRSEWDRLVEGHPFAEWRWLQVTEKVLLGHQPRYVLVRQAGELVAGAVCSLQDRFQSRLLQATLGWLPRRLPVLRCGVPISYNPGLFLSREKDASALWPALLGGIQQLLRRENASFHTFDYLSPQDLAWAFLQGNGYHRIQHLTETNLDICWASMEEYVSKLPKKKRSEYVRVHGHLERQGISIAETDPHSEDKTVLYQLVVNVFRRHGEPVLYDEDLFLRVVALLGDDFKLVVARQNGEILGCVALVRSGNEWMAKWAGLNYERTLNTGTYYGLLAECVRQAIHTGGKRLRLGATAYQTKQHFCVVAEERIGALAVRGRPLHWLAGKALRLTANSEDSQSLPKPVENKGAL